MRRTLAFLAAIVACVTGAAPSAHAETRYANTTEAAWLTFPALACGETATRTVWLRRGAEDVEVSTPVAGQPLHEYIHGHVATVSAIDNVIGGSGRTGVALTATGAGAVCGPLARHIYEDEAQPEDLRYKISYRYALPPGAMTTCRKLKWRGGARMVARNGRVRCRTAVVLARRWVKASKRHVASCRYCVLRRAKIRGFSCVHRKTALACRRGQQRVVWNVRRPAKPKPPPKPTPGPLGWGEAKKAALRIANNFPIYVEHRKVTWCNRWSEWEVHCGVRGWNATYDYDLKESFVGDSCSDTAYVTKRPGQRARVRGAGDASCFYD